MAIKAKYQRVRGMYDILPNESDIWSHINLIARKVFLSYGFKQIETPMVERTQTFTRTSGDSSDIVTKQMYSFHDKGGRDISLRPEGTAGVVRAYVQDKMYGPQYAKPVKLFYEEPMFRYERPGATHSREFHQIGCEVLGAISPQIDAENIELALDIFKAVHISHLRVEINTLGDKTSRDNYRKVLVKYFSQYKDQLSSDSQRRLVQNPLRILDSKAPEDQKFIANAPKIENSLTPESKAYFANVTKALDTLGISYVVDQKLVRGLDYYTDTVYEIMAKDPALGKGWTTICAGGRYNKMIGQFGGPDKSGGVGFAFGEERLLNVLKQKGIAEHQNNKTLMVMTATKHLTAQQQSTVFDKALKYAQGERQKHAYTNIYVNLIPRSLKSQNKQAHKMNAKSVVINLKDK